ncbi:hypothetical protein R3W88_026788 [Solanum pinnatisectum]|uniref:Uncharacterized protein n=1 Tax=Solanum pinnatisectum TaxID=50273 RepID=A0AAV9LGW3_9SOLN|nr:hypothetical protein R3W88_026788 [Solanum pinnatisectum]
MENFREYAVTWREQAARVKPPMKESEMIDVFLQAQEPDYFYYLLFVVGKTFAKVITVGEMVENGIKGKKRREDVATVVSAPSTYVQNNPPQHYFTSKNPQYPVTYSPYPGFSAQPIVTFSYPQWQMMNGCKEFSVPYKPILKVGIGIDNLANVVDFTKMVPSGVERMSEKLSPSNTPILTMKGALEDVWASQKEAILVFSKRAKQAYTDPVRSRYSPFIMKIFNEAHVPNEVTASLLGKIARTIFEVNRIAFSDDKLPVEGTRHNQGLHITVKYELSYVIRVLIDGGSGANIYPLSTPQKLNVSAEKVRPNNVYIELVLTIGHVDFTVNFQVLNINASFNLMLVRPWVHRAGVHGFEPGKGLGMFLQGRAYPVSPQKSLGTFGLGYKPIVEHKMKVTSHIKTLLRFKCQ